MRSMPPARGLGRSWAAFVRDDVVQLLWLVWRVLMEVSNGNDQCKPG